ncbi:hypothetical protein K0B96_13910 [Horticoccus luteus]|uniref:Uncharacterized protein n=1 Tax=Horticoccus luteus TaxID=2862869 RepID=A0A8F9XJ81_9BACT|nr:hypothetical protein [Horticoccus luteus]QYM78383.1 hypothetical protein K0B96_13910 [Horticoccus luteus]
MAPRRSLLTVFPAWLIAAAALMLTLAPATRAAIIDRVEIAPTKTSIYIGSVAMTMAPFERHGERYDSTYHAKIRPYFFYSESGRLSIDVSDAALAQLARGEPIEFKGEGYRDDGAKRGIAGRAVPTDATSGQIKVRVYVTTRIVLVFNTTYRFVGEPTTAP